ncbi:MAG TPA: ATP-binding protein [Candidatus Dormibacteraeota bacterium]|nr:ATP-binding protein [Candidatus Dormibacteraeota bacterium]
MGSRTEPFEFHATFSQLDEGLEKLHESVQLLRDASGRGPDDTNVMHFEIALAEIGANVLTHGRPNNFDLPVEYELRLEHDTALASFIDRGPAVLDFATRAMPDTSSESGRGLPMARWLLDELLYKRDGEVNRWRLVKQL